MSSRTWLVCLVFGLTESTWWVCADMCRSTSSSIFLCNRGPLVCWVRLRPLSCESRRKWICRPSKPSRTVFLSAELWTKSTSQSYHLLIIFLSKLIFSLHHASDGWRCMLFQSDKAVHTFLPRSTQLCRSAKSRFMSRQRRIS